MASRKKPTQLIINIPADELDNIGKTRLTDDIFLQIAKALDDTPQKLAALLEPLHPADIADVLERMTRKSREIIVEHIPTDTLGEVINELESGVQEHILNLLNPQEMREAIAELDSNDAADIAQIAEDIADEDGPDAEDLIDDHQVSRLLEYEAHTAGGLMQLEVVTALPDTSVSDALAHLRDESQQHLAKPGTVFVVNAQRKLLGTVSLSRLVQMPLTASLEAVMRKNPLTIHPEAREEEVVSLFEKYDIHNLAVLNPRGQLLGRITIDDILDVVMEQNARQRARAAGVDEGEDLFAPAIVTARHRMPWLLVNLLTAIAAAAVIALFEGTIAQLTTLAILMPIVTSMGGNATTQTQTVMIRAMALGQVTRQNAWSLFVKEFTVGAYKGVTLGLLIALGTWALYKQSMLALVIAMATIINHFIAAFAGWATPLFLKKYKFDPAIATGVITTTFTDVGGFFVFLGLATLLLL
jgi:magnesium transporter